MIEFLSAEPGSPARAEFWLQIIGGVPRTLSPHPYPADLARALQDDAGKSRHAQLQTLAIVLVWLMAIIVPIVQARLSAEAQTMTDAEVGTLSLALAITALMKQHK